MVAVGVAIGIGVMAVANLAPHIWRKFQGKQQSSEETTKSKSEEHISEESISNRTSSFPEKIIDFEEAIKRKRAKKVVNL